MEILQADLFIDKKILFISPHPDDLAFSCGGMNVKYFKGSLIYNLVVFSLSKYVLKQECLKLDYKNISSIRMEEDLIYCNKYGIQRLDLHFEDSSMVGYDDENELMVDPRDDGRNEKVDNEINATIARLSPDIILSPSAIGNHIDHLIVNNAIRKIGRGTRYVYYYEDMPYAAESELRYIRSYMFDVLKVKEEYEYPIKEIINHKISDMQIYKSQIDKGKIKLMVQHAKRISRSGNGYSERLWR